MKKKIPAAAADVGFGGCIRLGHKENGFSLHLSLLSTASQGLSMVSKTPWSYLLGLVCSQMPCVCICGLPWNNDSLRVGEDVETEMGMEIEEGCQEERSKKASAPVKKKKERKKWCSDFTLTGLECRVNHLVPFLPSLATESGGGKRANKKWVLLKGIISFAASTYRAGPSSKPHSVPHKLLCLIIR